MAYVKEKAKKAFECTEPQGCDACKHNRGRMLVVMNTQLREFAGMSLQDNEIYDCDKYAMVRFENQGGKWVRAKSGGVKKVVKEPEVAHEAPVPDEKPKKGKEKAA